MPSGNHWQPAIMNLSIVTIKEVIKIAKIAAFITQPMGIVPKKPLGNRWARRMPINQKPTITEMAMNKLQIINIKL